ncbi:hypothetical protein HYPSUDRAFT_203809 [Hypholoma sublateritium FD-334 SS-4]|uniref:Uncharacterized protein n=1 Tax=Hypholoma sublateritium (strain FD-334 SS-4) TaxID=945553 RepID=A0A0D2NVD4_HYPSF|nr:hypothetical protein HYPSUDRAFT_203809 [Hypholoma sublateritium FD-334 SS-4]
MIKSAVMGTVIPWEGPTELYDRLSAEYQRVSAELNHFKSECHDLRNKIQQDRVQYITLENELSHVRRELADSRHLADARGKELFGAQVFLSTTDILSVSEIAQKAAELNDEIFQAAALLAESLIHEVSNWAPQDEQNKSLTVALGMLGGPIVDAITSSSGPEINPYLIQLVLQISLTRFCGDKLGKWYEKDEITNEVLVNIYKEIFRTEEQAVSGRWRAITHAKTRLKTDNWAFELNNNLTHILRVASLLSPTVSDSLSTFEQKLSPIFRAIINLHIALGEQFTSADITPVVVTSGAAFEAEWMEDALSDARTSGRGNFKVNSVPLETADVVAATLGIGLRQRMPHPALKGSGNLGHVIILPPKVILQSTLTEILEPFV